MSLKVRSMLVVAVGTALGLTVSIGSTIVRDIAPAAAAQHESDPYVALLADVMHRIQREYVEPVDRERLVESAIRGMLEELDPHSKYLDPSQYEDIRISTTGTYTGVGLDVSVRDGRVTVVTPLDGGPAERAGVLPGDVVVAVDHVPIVADQIDRAVGRMRGKPGTPVSLAVERQGLETPLEFELTRSEITVNTVTDRYLGDGFGYIRISGFTETTATELDSAAQELRAEAGGRLAGVVLDLRNNPGGVLNSAVAVADRFLDAGLIVRGSGRVRHARFEQHAQAGNLLEEVELVVLVNAGSASGSEIVAAALKDNGRALLIGERTYGKGSVQSVMPIGHGTAIKLTTARYFTPSGISINGTGIEPNVVVKGDAVNIYRGRGSMESLSSDVQLSEALRRIGYDPIALSQAP